MGKWGIVVSVILPLLWSCGLFEPETAVLWTDRPEFALYAEYFNAAQDRYKVETRYFSSPAQELTGNGASYPDLVTGAWLKSASTRVLFRPLDYLFKDKRLSRLSFYSHLLDLGNLEGKQYLLPVSFNIPAMVFSRNNSYLLGDSFTVTPDEIKELGKAYNVETNGTYSRMGFSPSWNDEFLFIIATLFNTSFREATPLAWETDALENAMVYVRNWIGEVNGGIRAEDDFVFKYFYVPPSNLAISGRILFTYMDSAELFTLTQEKRANLDFRWIARANAIPLSEETVYLGICKRGKAKKAATAFAQWFFYEETQRYLLEASRDKRLNETLFGIGNGFSAMKTVTEHIFPQFYPSLLGHMPPEDFLSPPNILPRNWTALKERVLLPYLHERIRADSHTSIRPLERRLTDWLRLNRGL
jgi:ABC-type glycerol-3-phosphate transport system substrate-binding protein